MFVIFCRNKPTLIVQSLTSLITDANLGELTSLEELVLYLFMFF